MGVASLAESAGFGLESIAHLRVFFRPKGSEGGETRPASSPTVIDPSFASDGTRDEGLSLSCAVLAALQRISPAAAPAYTAVPVLFLPDAPSTSSLGSTPAPALDPEAAAKPFACPLPRARPLLAAVVTFLDAPGGI